MCGIAGILSIDGRPISDEEVAQLRTASDALRHRGPDDEGLWTHPSRHAALIHRRLAIIDPTPEGHQPMQSRSGNRIVFNGEIYNYQELRRAYRLNVPPSDTAVLLALLELKGNKILPELRGFFSFAYWDESKRSLLLARDAIGKKPLYYSLRNGRCMFASELRALLSSGLIPCTISRAALSEYLRFYCVPHPFSMIEGVQMLPPGSMLEISEHGDVAMERWYRLPEYLPIAIEYPDAVRETRRILERSVHDRLVSDVPVGAFLSGGLDSNVVVGLAAQNSKNPLETFSIGFRSNYTENELPTAEIGARAFGTAHHSIEISDSDVAFALEDFFSSMDSPTGDGLNSFLISRAARNANPTFKVVLSGVGGDEAFLGYRKYRWLAQRSSILALLWKTPQPLRSGLATLLTMGADARWKTAIATLLHPEATRILFRDREINELTGSALPYSGVRSAASPLVSLLRFDLEHYLPNMLLRDLDAMTMSHSLEARAPLLDKELLEFTWQLPMNVKARGRSKQLLIDAAHDLLPHAIKQKPKTGFELPMREWLLEGKLRPWLDVLLTDTLELAQDGFLTVPAVRKIHQEFVGGRSHYLKPWNLIALEMWYRNIKSDSIGIPNGAKASASGMTVSEKAGTV